MILRSALHTKKYTKETKKTLTFSTLPETKLNKRDLDEKKLNKLFGNISNAFIAKINESEDFKIFITHLIDANDEVAHTRWQTAIERRGLLGDKDLHIICNHVAETLLQNISNTSNAYSLFWNIFQLTWGSESAKFVIYTLNQIGQSTVENYMLIDDNITLVNAFYNLGRIVMPSAEDWELLKESIFLQIGINNLTKINCFSEEIWIHIKKDPILQQAINNLLRINCFSESAWIRIKEDATLQQAINNLTKINCFSENSWIHIKEDPILQQAINNLLRINCFSENSWIHIKEDATLQQAINNLANISCLSVENYEEIKINPLLQNATDHLAEIRCLSKEDYNLLKSNNYLIYAINSLVNIQSLNEANFKLVKNNIPLQKSILHYETQNKLNKNSFSRLITHNAILLKNKIKNESGEEFDIFQQIDEFQEHVGQINNQNYKDHANKFIQEIYERETAFLLTGDIKVFHGLQNNSNLAKLKKMDQLEPWKKGIKLALAIVVSLLTLPLGGVLVLANQIRKNPYRFFPDKRNASKLGQKIISCDPENASNENKSL